MSPATPPACAVSYKRHRFPAEIISHCVWLSHRFGLSLRDVEELLAERGVTLTYEAIRLWCRKFGPVFAAGLKRRRPRPGANWHLDEVQLKLNGRTHWLWRAVDCERRNANGSGTILMPRFMPGRGSAGAASRSGRDHTFGASRL